MTDVYAEAFDVPDTIPPDLSDVEHPCSVCGREAGTTPTGRARKKCDDCRPGASKNPTPRKVSGRSAQLATQATEVLSQYNGFVGMLAMAVGMNKTAVALFERNELFKAQAQEALTTDEEFCRWIIGGGRTSAKFTLSLAYLSLGASVGPIAYEEWREKHPKAEAEE